MLLLLQKPTPRTRWPPLPLTLNPTTQEARRRHTIDLGWQWQIWQGDLTFDGVVWMWRVLPWPGLGSDQILGTWNLIISVAWAWVRRRFHSAHMHLSSRHSEAYTYVWMTMAGSSLYSPLHSQPTRKTFTENSNLTTSCTSLSPTVPNFEKRIKLQYCIAYYIVNPSKLVRRAHRFSVFLPALYNDCVKQSCRHATSFWKIYIRSFLVRIH
jgi:hypothetical protein